jgi:hypothetical protein
MFLDYLLTWSFKVGGLGATQIDSQLRYAYFRDVDGRCSDVLHRKVLSLSMYTIYDSPCYKELQPEILIVDVTSKCCQHMERNPTS